jgi:hypothetical protein
MIFADIRMDFSQAEMGKLQGANHENVHHKLALAWRLVDRLPSRR